MNLNNSKEKKPEKFRDYRDAKAKYVSSSPTN